VHKLAAEILDYLIDVFFVNTDFRRGILRLVQNKISILFFSILIIIID